MDSHLLSRLSNLFIPRHFGYMPTAPTRHLLVSLLASDQAPTNSRTNRIHSPFGQLGARSFVLFEIYIVYYELDPKYKYPLVKVFHEMLLFPGFQ